MKKISVFIFSVLLFASMGFTNKTKTSREENDLTWYTDVLKASEISSSSGKPIFAFFTGSDWCGWCKKLQNEVFAKPGFIEWAKKNVVLLELDFPRHKQLSTELAQQNANLQQAFEVQGFPTIWIFFLNKDEKTMKFNISPLGSLGYPPSPEPGKEEVKFLQEANSILEKKNIK